jgi:hypothetical protein
MSSPIDKLALTCRLLYDQRVLEQRREIETLKLKLFFRDYTHRNLKQAMLNLNRRNTECRCSSCNKAGRMCPTASEDEETTCTFCPWFDGILQEHGLVVLRKEYWEEEFCEGPYEDEQEKISGIEFTGAYFFTDDDCHLKDKPYIESGYNPEPSTRWEEICIGKRLWSVESIDNPIIKQFERIFGASETPFSSP